MKAIKDKNFTNPIILIKILNNGDVFIVDDKTTIRILEKEKLDLIDGYKANNFHLRYRNSVVAFSNDSKYFATVSADSNEAKLYSMQTRKIIHVVDKHNGEVSCVGIDNASKYMFSCGDDGKTFATDIESGDLAFALPIHIDAVTDIAFSSNGNWVATSSYDRKISIFNLAMMAPKHKLRYHSVAVMKISFIGKDRLLSIDKNNTAIIWNIYTGKVIIRLKGIHDDVTQILIAQNNKFLFLGTSLGYVLVYDLDTYEQISRKYVKTRESISSLAFDEESKYLYVASKSCDLSVYDIYGGEDYIKSLLKEKKYDSIHFFIETNPLLAYTKIDILLSKLWENTLKKAKISLQHGDRLQAIALFHNFKNIPEKNKIMNHILEEYVEYDRFAELVEQDKVSLAYGLLQKHPLYKETVVYKSLDAKWKKAFYLAQKYIMDPKGIDKAREILAPYRGISDKTKLTQELFAQGEVYKRFKVSLGQKDFKIVFELIKLHPFLKEFPEYKSIMDYGDSLYIKSQKFMDEDDTHSTTKILRILIDFPDFSTEVKELSHNIEVKQKFYKAIRDKDMISAYNMLSLSEDLLETEDGRDLQDRWNRDLIKANSFAMEGNVEAIKVILDDYMVVNSKYVSLGSIFGWCYMTQIERAIEHQREQAFIENGIKNYILSFGLQDQILSLFEIFISEYSSSKLNLRLLSKGDLKMWRPSMIVNSILD